MKTFLSVVFLTLPLLAQQPYDIVLQGGRVIDPESKLDAIRHVGIRQGKIAAVSNTPLTGKVILDATGMIVSPGFIDLHSHGQTPENYRYKAMDGALNTLNAVVAAPSSGFVSWINS